MFDNAKPRESPIGEDTWDLFEVIERSFDVDLGDYFALADIEVGELAEKISSQAAYPSEERCPSSVAFYELRRGLVAVMGVSRRAVRPSTRIAQLSSFRVRRRQWRALEEHLGLKIPALRFPGWLLLLCLLAPAALLTILRIVFLLRLSVLEIIGGTLAATLPAIFFALALARTIPAGCETVGGLAETVLSLNYAAFARKHGSRSAEDVLLALRRLVACEMSMRLEEISATTKIPSDLNIY